MLFIILYIPLAIWTYVDAKKRRSDSTGTLIGIIFLGIVTIPLHFAQRNLKEGEIRKGGRAWNFVKFFVPFLFAFFILAVFPQSKDVSWSFTIMIILSSITLGVGLLLKKPEMIEVGPTGALSTQPSSPSQRPIAQTIVPAISKAPRIIGALVLFFLALMLIVYLAERGMQSSTTVQSEGGQAETPPTPATTQLHQSQSAVPPVSGTPQSGVSTRGAENSNLRQGNSTSALLDTTEEEEDHTPRTVQRETVVPPKVGDIVRTEYFEIVVNKVQLTKRIQTGNEFLDQAAPDGSHFLELDVSIKNIDNESRLFAEGSLIINYNGRRLQYDKTETIIGYTLSFEQLNPLTRKTGRIVYIVPEELSGILFWNPGRSNVAVMLGKIGS